VCLVVQLYFYIYYCALSVLFSGSGVCICLYWVLNETIDYFIYIRVFVCKLLRYVVFFLFVRLYLSVCKLSFIRVYCFIYTNHLSL